MATLSSTTPVPRPSSQDSQTSSFSHNSLSMKPYDFLLKFLLVGDSDVGKEEILNGLANGTNEFPYGYSNTGILFKTTTITLDGKKVKLQLWDASGQGRFCTIFRSYSRGAHGILLVYDITNRWSFDGIDRWIKEIDELAPGVPKILVGNRCHLAFKREVSELAAEEYAIRNGMTFYEVSSLCDFNVTESLIELTRVALRRNGLRSSWGLKTVMSLQESCTRVIVDRTSLFNIDKLPLPFPLRSQVKAYQVSNKPHPRTSSSTLHSNKPRKHKIIRPSDSPSSLSYNHSCSIT